MSAFHRTRYILLTALVVTVEGSYLACSPESGAPTCGDGVINQVTELCDGDDFRASTCRDYGLVRGELSCSDACQVETDACESPVPGPSTCGNGIIERGEQCDEAVAAGLDCARLDLGVGELRCASNCTLDLSACSDGGSASGASSEGPAFLCGDGQCADDESCESCPEDCGPCGSACGDGQCASGEACADCPQDCGSCPASDCGDNSCDTGETCASCPGDCGACPAACGDGQCNGGETCKSCPGDCGACPASCGDGQCNGGETCEICAEDCGACPASCGDGQCNGGETCTNCPGDCGACLPVCGDGQCGGGETCGSCPEDCGACCQASDHWSPTSSSETDSKGLQWNQTIDVPIKVEVQQDDAGLKVQVCKPGSIFTTDVAFHIYDGASNKGWVEVPTLDTAGKPCSAWVQLNNDGGYDEGEQFGGIWQLVSPATSRSDWDWPASSCSVNGQPTGTCWNGVDPTLTRTCK